MRKMGLWNGKGNGFFGGVKKGGIKESSLEVKEKGDRGIYVSVYGYMEGWVEGGCGSV